MARAPRMLVTPQAVKGMPPQRAAFRHVRVFKRARLPHPEARHHGTRAGVSERREGNDRGQLEYFESNTQSFPRRFGGEPTAPVMRGEAPSDLHTGRERKRGGRDV